MYVKSYSQWDAEQKIRVAHELLYEMTKPIPRQTSTTNPGPLTPEQMIMLGEIRRSTMDSQATKW